MPIEDALEDQIRYYRSRARQCPSADASEAAALIDLFDEFPLGSNVLEFAAGTGFWTERIVKRGAIVTAIDAAPEALEVSRERLGGGSSAVRYVVADLLHWEPRRQWDSCVGFFWLCKIPDRQLPSFLKVAMAALRDGGSFFFGDKLLPPTTVRTTEVETRVLDDGRAFTIVDRPRSATQFQTAFAEIGAATRVVAAGRHSAILGTKGETFAG